MRLLFFLLALIFTVASMAHPSYGIELNDRGNLYFVDIVNNERGTVWKWSEKNGIEILFKNFHAHNVNRDNQGNIYIAHGESHQMMLRISPAGKLDTLVYVNDYKQFNGGNCAVSPDGTICFGSDHFIWKIGSDGKSEKAHPFYVEWNQGIFVDGEGRIYAIDIGRGSGCLYMLTPDGKMKLLADQLIRLTNGTFDPHAEVLLGVKKGEDGHIYVSDIDGRRIHQVSLDGKVETYYTAEEGWIPTGIVFGQGNDYMMEFKKENIQGTRIISYQKGKKKVVFDNPRPSTINNNDLPSWIQVVMILSFALFIITGYLLFVIGPEPRGLVVNSPL